MIEALLCILIGIEVLMFFRKNSNTYLGQIKEYQPEKEVTTVLPLPIQAATCDHDWDKIVDKTLEMPHEKKAIIVLQCTKCGTIDKTVQVTSPKPHEDPKPCAHEWDTVVNEQLDAPHEKRLVCILTCKKCGLVDKTTEVTSKPPPAAPSRSECRHKWEKEKIVVLDSAYEQMLKSISHKEAYSRTAKVDPQKKLDLDLNDCEPWMFRKSYISIRTCPLCGEIDKTIAHNFDDEESEEEQAQEQERVDDDTIQALQGRRLSAHKELG